MAYVVMLALGLQRFTPSLTPSQLRQLQTDRYLVVPDFLPNSLVDALRADALDVGDGGFDSTGVGLPALRLG